MAGVGLANAPNAYIEREWGRKEFAEASSGASQLACGDDDCVVLSYANATDEVAPAAARLAAGDNCRATP